MLKLLSEVAPKAVVAAVLIWAGANYLVIGPNVAARVAGKDFVPVCKANLQAWATASGKRKEEALPAPSANSAQDMAMTRLRAIRDNPLMRELDNSPLGALMGLGATMDIAAAQIVERKQQAQQAYDKARAFIRQETATQLGKAGDICGCLADEAISQTRQDWALFTGTLGFLRPTSVAQLGTKMQQAYDGGSCGAAKAGQ